MRGTLVGAAIMIGLLALAGSASAQPDKNRTHRSSFGHLHVHPSDNAAHRKFWIDDLRAAIGHVGTMEVSKFPGGLIEWISPSWGDAKPKGGTRGTSVDHIGLSVPNVDAAMTRLTAAGYKTVTHDVARASKDKHVFVMGPDELLLELVEVKGQTVAYAMDHIHFTTPQPAETEAWYAKILAAARGKRDTLNELEIPGTRLTFSQSKGAVAGTKGTSLDHIGFEVRNLEAFTKELEGMGVKVERYVKTNMLGGLSIAYLTDPWGTYVELSDGLDRVE